MIVTSNTAFKPMLVLSLFLLQILLFTLTQTEIQASPIWKETSNMIYSEANHYSFVQDSKIYSIGGSGGSGMPSNSTFSEIGQDGVLTSWSHTSSTLPERSWVTGANTDKYAYILGGIENGTYNNVQSVFVGNLQPNGDILDWRTTTPLFQPLSLGGSIIMDNKILYAGGDTESHTYSITATDEIYISTINNDGSLGNWTVVGKLPEKLHSFGFLEFNNYIYVIGGYSNSGASAHVWRTKMDRSDYTLGAWEAMQQLPIPVWVAAYTRVGNTIIVAGGHNGTSFINSLHYSTINPDGTLSSWIARENILPDVNGGAALAYWNSNLYLIGGHNGVDFFDTVYFGNLSNILGSHIPVTKTILTPGLGASWSLKDFISCSKTSNQSDWSLAPYAKSVYTGILEALNGADWITLPFYYDWRHNVSDNSTLLANFIDQNTDNNEKINFVGHSMGGLVGRGYMEASSGGKLAKYYSVGTPHQGSALAYAPWGGGEVWTNNLVEKIGIDLYLKHCGGFTFSSRQVIQSIFPSIQNLLPTLPYLRDKKTGDIKDIASMKVKNNFITENFVAPFWNVKVGTLSGDGQKTLSIIDVITPSKFDNRLGNWIDGSPVKKEYSDEGDGTVLKSSSNLTGAFQNDVINQTHRGLVGSTEGINTILSFIGSPGIEDPEYQDDTSALVLVGYPGTFRITDEKGVMTSSENGMIAIMNPTTSNYQIEFDPTDSRTTLIIDQFLSNGESSYKEYKYPKAPVDVKILEFNSKKANRDPIHEAKEYKRPRFPSSWHGFWKWWFKYHK